MAFPSRQENKGLDDLSTNAHDNLCIYLDESALEMHVAQLIYATHQKVFETRALRITRMNKDAKQMPNEKWMQKGKTENNSEIRLMRE